MRFHLVDRILECEPGKFLRGEKHLTLGEEYLRDHFPGFPVMPGVLMLQALVECGAWLWRVTGDFDKSVIVLREARNVKYGTFMAPGKTLELRAELVKIDGDSAIVKGKGTAGGATMVSTQLVLVGYNLADQLPDGADRDVELVANLRNRYGWLTRPT